MTPSSTSHLGAKPCVHEHGGEMRDRQRIEAALDRVAELLDAGHDYLVPIFERLERELEAATRERSALDRARERARKAA